MKAIRVAYRRIGWKTPEMQEKQRWADQIMNDLEGQRWGSHGDLVVTARRVDGQMAALRAMVRAQQG